MKDDLNLIHSPPVKEPKPKPKRTLTPRLRDLEHETVSVRLPVEQISWLEVEAQKGFRGRSDQIALIINSAYLASEGLEP
jgi:hypothetical protein